MYQIMSEVNNLQEKLNLELEAIAAELELISMASDHAEDIPSGTLSIAMYGLSNRIKHLNESLVMSSVHKLMGEMKRLYEESEHKD